MLVHLEVPFLELLCVAGMGIARAEEREEVRLASDDITDGCWVGEGLEGEFALLHGGRDAWFTKPAGGSGMELRWL